ncbi:unnamed protein product [Moneuplotes crassus]|uniref:Uncharacterized protein n=1 Tax=Euplotes crassus TaxID=5936 RepID=A0AAD1Y684_EUPCR|nr:unnamed protein product [Moneuplotes crassus]|mmetsp:Transcript_20998/g.20719  ORF Transcript_20998/g.20719 Transcript_20998/m.20719 type:complete len:84 (+) Transcript_20998:39-290(+)|eukprot:CAMPEP_0197003770 /NCGR_PEP_ID=MMETSP1380-20130617/12855_1 /TAXON_ID=5936 /ORGANISM="Euplotes crassus, Strain CT5" /LENGTH=83 /DNA_ID=CAMNT_0042422365 /DNA_START=32 /DNA_END=283 /DNA_ORIENTATION=+
MASNYSELFEQYDECWKDVEQRWKAGETIDMHECKDVSEELVNKTIAVVKERQEKEIPTIDDASNDPLNYGINLTMGAWMKNL